MAVQIDMKKLAVIKEDSLHLEVRPNHHDLFAIFSIRGDDAVQISGNYYDKGLADATLKHLENKLNEPELPTPV